MHNYVSLLNLEKHIEGGYFGLFYKSTDDIIVSDELQKNIKRSAGTSIYFMLENDDFSAWHRLKSDEVWHYYDGNSPIDIHVIDPTGMLTTYTVGNPSLDADASFQVFIKAGCWFAAEVRDKSSFGLVGCTVSPGFEYADFELANRDQLSSQFPELSAIIFKYTRSKSAATSSNTNQIIDKSISETKNKRLSAQEYTNLLKLDRHIEGGYFSIFYKSQTSVTPIEPRYYIAQQNIKPIDTSNSTTVIKQRSAGTSIYFMLENNDFSAWHRIKSDEIWHYYDGNSPIDIHVIDPTGMLTTYTVGNPSLDADASFQVLIKAGYWFAAEVRDKSSFGLVGCTVSPGFEYADFELANRDQLSSQFPELSAVIKKFTKDLTLATQNNTDAHEQIAPACRSGR